MANGNTITITGGVTRDPELKFTGTSKAVCTFSVAWKAKKDAPVSFLSVVCWEQLAEHVAASVSKGSRVTVSGRLTQRTYETSDGLKREKVEIVAEDVAVSIRFAPLNAQPQGHFQHPDASREYPARPPAVAPAPQPVQQAQRYQTMSASC